MSITQLRRKIASANQSYSWSNCTALRPDELTSPGKFRISGHFEQANATVERHRTQMTIPKFRPLDYRRATILSQTYQGMRSCIATMVA
jgi:hypothetical protein